MLMPKRHIESFSDLLPEEFLQINRLIVESEKALKSGLGAIGINGGWNQGGCAGAGVDGHLHVHMLPRWPGDTNFLTTVAETRVISQSLEESYENLKPFFMEII